MTKLAKRARKARRSSIAKGAPTQLVTVKPSPLLAAAFSGVVSFLRGNPAESVIADAISGAVAVTDTRKCTQCGAFVLWKHDAEAAPICKCGADMTNAPRATREHVHESVKNWNKPKH